MPKTFYTERDIVDMFKRGVHSLEISDDVALTDLAFEKANRLGVKLVGDKPETPPAAPIRPYISQLAPPPPADTPQHAPVRPYISEPATPAPAAKVESGDLQRRIHDAVVARLGSQVDAKLLDVIIQRVLDSTGVK